MAERHGVEEMRVPTIGAVFCLAAVLSASGATPPLAAQPTEWHFTAQSARPVPLPSWLVSDSLRAALGYVDPSRPVAAFRGHINHDGTVDYVLRASVSVCGSNCEYILVDGKTRSVLGRVGGSAVFVGPPTVNGYPVIRTYGHSSADSGRWSVSVFDGERYVVVSSVYLEGESASRLFETLRDIPFWPTPAAEGTQDGSD